jgi:hypothetical protein
MVQVFDDEVLVQFQDLHELWAVDPRLAMRVASAWHRPVS